MAETMRTVPTEGPTPDKTSKISPDKMKIWAPGKQGGEINGESSCASLRCPETLETLSYLGHRRTQRTQLWCWCCWPARKTALRYHWAELHKHWALGPPACWQLFFILMLHIKSTLRWEGVFCHIRHQLLWHHLKDDFWFWESSLRSSKEQLELSSCINPGETPLETSEQSVLNPSDQQLQCKGYNIFSPLVFFDWPNPALT